jgi:hypothetical protein
MTRSRTPEDQSTQQRDPGPKALLCAMCIQAMTDYFILRRIGAVKWGQPTGKYPSRPGHQSYVYADMTPVEVEELVAFVKRDLSRVLDLVGIDLPSHLVVKRLMELERSGQWQDFFSTGKGQKEGGEPETASPPTSPPSGDLVSGCNAGPPDPRGDGCTPGCSQPDRPPPPWPSRPTLPAPMREISSPAALTP